MSINKHCSLSQTSASVSKLTCVRAAVVRPFTPKLIRKLAVPKADLRTMREASRNVLLVRHTYNLVDLPIVIGGKSGTAEFGLRDSDLNLNLGPLGDLL